MRPSSLLATALAASLLTLGAITPRPALAGTPQEATAELAEQGRTLSLRATKAYLMAQQGITPDASRRILADSIARMDQNITTLHARKLDEPARGKLAELDRVWGSVRTQLSAPPSAEGARSLYDGSDALERAAHHLTIALNANAPEASRRLVLPNRLRALSQRIALFYLYRASSLMTPHAPEVELIYARGEFPANLSRAEKTGNLPADAQQALAELSRTYPAYHASAGKLDAAPAMLKTAPAVMEMSEQILVTTEKLVASLLAQ
ncbi:hypothetical protein [Zoogloea sp.]|uniref:hypothetical protein n=1 Tax=Zoogloea sp. TaxID=49181 RepID=UPI0025CBBB66|nr:hypothetical protein [Zoogloea sp.]MCK6395927.1 hypothetical protein [Zoogloea sp.]